MQRLEVSCAVRRLYRSLGVRGLKFNAIKFYTVLMNWLIQKKMFTYFYNKFRPVNRMYYIKCSVNSSFLT